MKKNTNVLLILSIIFLLSSCYTNKLEDRAGFDSNTNTVVELGGYSFEIPEYYGEPTDNIYTVHEDNGQTCMVNCVFDSSDIDIEEEFVAEYMQIIEKSSTNFKGDATNFSGEINGSEYYGTSKYFYNEDSKQYSYLIFMSTYDSDYDYLPDFQRVLDSAKKIEVPQISEDFKKSMDEYEAWFDKYVEVMKKYKENPTDMSLMSEATSLISEEVTMLNEFNNLDRSQMSSAELSYYLEVQSRVLEKLSTVM